MSRRTLVRGLGGLAIAVSLTAVTAPAAFADEDCGRFTDNTGVVCATIESTSSQSIGSYGANFTAAGNLVRPRIKVDMLDEAGRRMTGFEQSWDTDRLHEVVNRRVDKSFAVPVGRVCATLFEAGGEAKATACVVNPTSGG